MFRLIAMFSVLIIVQSMVAQNHTVGTIRLESGAYDGFNILNPLAYDTTYIIDNCGRVVNQWHGNYSNGMFAEVTVGGTLFKSGISTVNTSIHAGGGSGILQEFDWNNNLLWEYEISDSTHRLHHDLEILPNGNLLGIAWERKDSLDCVNAGRDTSTLASGEMWFTAIYEIQPVYPDSALIV
ncbi:MAG: hypothetical protein MRY83_16210, partial [Flavobacteriales bacterium]|nr:hypothetical protein [Flavobacteriales bacterium]